MSLWHFTETFAHFTIQVNIQFQKSNKKNVNPKYSIRSNLGKWTES